MPYSVNGCGTGLVKSSRPRKIAGQPHFDAIETVQLFYIPVLPYKAIHVVSHCQDPKDMEKEQYQSYPLRPAPRIFLKALLNGWGMVLIVFGGVFTAIAGFASANMERAFTQTDLILICISSGMVVAGILAKIVWWIMDAADNRIKDVLGVHPYGASDPYYWVYDTAHAAAKDLVTQESAASLLEVADRAMHEGNRAQAMLSVRLAMRDTSQSAKARVMFDQLLQSSRTN